jgi:SAM-dependent methyltransferase
MSDWGSGYVTDTAYVYDFCRLQAPAMLRLAALAGGVAAPGEPGEDLVWCDLGCGQGYTANLVAAANPSARVFGFDFNPGHISNARALARAAGLSNVAFREASFEELLADQSLPEFDVICMHGVFSWVSPENRAAIVALLRKRLKAGGLLYVSYNCMPGWAAVAPLRRIFAQHFAPGTGGSSQRGAERALAYWESLRGVDPRFIRVFPGVESQMARLKNTPSAYFAHEMLNSHWEAFSFSEVAAELAHAKLAYVGSAHLADGVDRLNFTPEQLEFLASLGDPMLAEATRDMILGRQFRRDIFVKGFVAQSPARQRAAWLSTRFALTTPGAELALEFETVLGKHKFHPAAHVPLLDVLRKGPIVLGDALEQAFGREANLASTMDLVKVLVGRGDLQPTLSAAGDAARAASTRAFNAAVLAQASEGAELFYLASPVTGGGVRVDRLTQLYLLARRKHPGDIEELVKKLAQGAVLQGEDGKPLAPEEAQASLKQKLARIEADVAPLLLQLGIGQRSALSACRPDRPREARVGRRDPRGFRAPCRSSGNPD